MKKEEQCICCGKRSDDLIEKRCEEFNTYCQHSKKTKLPVQEIQKSSAKCLILLGPRGQKTGKSDLTVELGWTRSRFQ